MMNLARLAVCGCVLAGSSAWADPAPPTVACATPTRINGNVRAGEDFTQPITDGLVFALMAERNAPPNPRGWTISVYSKDAPAEDLLWAANPPYRGLNVRDLTLSYGQTAAQVVARNPRSFAFYVDRMTNARAQAWVRDQLWPGKEHDELAAQPPAQGEGEFRIDAYTFGTADSETFIKSMKFHVVLCMERHATAH